MTPSIKQRIEQIQCGEVPEGYSMERAMLYPNDWGTPVRLNTILWENKTRNEDMCYDKKDVLSVSGEQGIVNQIELLIDVPQEVIDSIEITVGPYFKWKNEELFEQLQHEGRIKDSAFRGLVNYRELCSMCQHGSFARK